MGSAFTAIDKLQKTLNKNLEVAFNRENMNDIANIMINNIVTRARLGKGVSNGKQKNFDKPLTEKYIDFRKKHSKRLANTTSANQKKSNATATGQMLESISSKVNPGFILLFFKGKRKGELDGRTSKLSNDEVAEFFQKKRPFFEITSADVNEIKRYIRSIIVNR